ncbi:wu:fc21g02 isoform X2 [Sardina pilchardus]|uniref:wu:fc21g02 isoform X2 n=1 Tax=Sardina pilchardus TaxID=27697 RepID=UPI002E16686C
MKMWSLLILLVAVLNVDCYYTTREKLAHGRRLTIKISKETEKLEFKPEDGSSMETIWSRGQFRPTKGRLTGSSSSSSSSDQRWELQTVVFDDEGTYSLKDYWNKETKSILLDVITEHNYINRVAGEDLSISLEGSNHHEATLQFTGEAGNFTLVRDGAPVGNDLGDYAGRVKISASGIIIKNVNTSDVGRYKLFDRRDRPVSVTRMTLVDKHEYAEPNPLLALLLLLGIPAGICCCCRKKIFRKKATTTATHVIHTDGPPPGGPPSYNTPSTPMVPPGSGGQVFYHGPTPDPNAGYAPGYPAGGGTIPPPQNPGYGQPMGPPLNPGYGQPAMPQGPGFQPGYDPQNPVYPPTAGPVAPQWNGPPPNQYNPAAPPGYAPVAYSAPPPTSAEPRKEEIKMNEMSPAAPLITPPQPQVGQPTDSTWSSSEPSKFEINAGTTNFL